MNNTIALQTLIEVATTHAYGVEIRLGAIEGLGHVAGSEARATLAQILADQNAGATLRAAAAKALGMAARPIPVPPPSSWNS